MRSGILAALPGGEETILAAGEVAVGRGDQILCSGPLGSCVALVLHHPHRNLTGMAHIMLPSGPADRSPADFRYAEPAITRLSALLGEPSSSGTQGDLPLVACAVGGANVLREPDDSLCAEINRSVLSGLKRRGIPLLRHDLGGVLRRQARVEVRSGRLYCAVGDRPESLFHEFHCEN